MMLKRAGLVVILISLSNSASSAFIKEDSFLNRFSFRVDYEYENWEAVFGSLRILTHQGDSTIEYNSTKEEIDWDNEHYDLYNLGNNFGLGVGVQITEWLRLDAGIGLAFLSIETFDVDYAETPDTNERVLDFVFINDRPGFYFSVGLDFRLPLYKGLYLSAAPGVSYTSIRNMHAVDPDHEYGDRAHITKNSIYFI